MAKEEKRVLTLDEYEHGMVITALSEYRKNLIEQGEDTDFVDEVLLMAIDAPSKKVRSRSNENR